MVCQPNFARLVLPQTMVLFPDLYGRGFSDAPSTTYDSVLYTTQLALLLQYLDWRSTNIVGVSMASCLDSPLPAVAEHPYRVELSPQLFMLTSPIW